MAMILDLDVSWIHRWSENLYH